MESIKKFNTATNADLITEYLGTSKMFAGHSPSCPPEAQLDAFSSGHTLDFESA